MRNWLVLPMLFVVFALLPLQAWSHVPMTPQSMNGNTTRSATMMSDPQCANHPSGSFGISAPISAAGHIACCFVTVPPLFKQTNVSALPAASPQVGFVVHHFLSYIPSLPVPPPKV